MKKIIAIIGRAGSGKNLAGDFLSQKLGIPSYAISEALRITARERGVSESRENLINIGKEFTENYGDEYLAKIIVENSESDTIIIIGMRQVGQLEYCKNNHITQFLGIESDSKLRFQRLLTINKINDDYEDFLRAERLDEGKVQNVSECLHYCSKLITNNTSIDDFFEKIKSTKF